MFFQFTSLFFLILLIQFLVLAGQLVRCFSTKVHPSLHGVSAKKGLFAVDIDH